MNALVLEKHLIWSRTDGNGGTSSLYYYDAVTWIVAALVLVWVGWFLVRRHKRMRSLKRKPGRTDEKALRQTVKIKRDLSSNYLRPGFSSNIHAVGVGLMGARDYCIQVFVKDVNVELWPGSNAASLPNSYRGIPIRLVEMASAGFLSESRASGVSAAEQFPDGIREQQEVIVGGISGANTNLTGQSGTIGYFCTRKRTFRRSKEIHLLSNSHVFADLRKPKADASDLIMQPSPGEAASNRPIGTLANFSALKFAGDITQPNHVDAAIAKLWRPQNHKAVIPLIGGVKGFVEIKDVEIGETVRKFGRTTGYTEGRIFSIYLDIWIRYDRTKQSAFFQDQILIEPSPETFTKFVASGDSGALLVDANQHAVGLIFAGTSEIPDELKSVTEAKTPHETEPSVNKSVRITGYGVANPISEVLDRLRIELLI